MRPALVLGVLAPVLVAGCGRPWCRRSACPVAVEPTSNVPFRAPAARTPAYFNEDEDADRNPARPEHLYPGPGETREVHDVRDLEARPGFDRGAFRRTLRAAVPGAAFQWRDGRLLSVGSEDAQLAVRAWLAGARADAAPALPRAPGRGNERGR